MIHFAKLAQEDVGHDSGGVECYRLHPLDKVVAGSLVCPERDNVNRLEVVFLLYDVALHPD